MKLYDQYRQAQRKKKFGYGGVGWSNDWTQQGSAPTGAGRGIPLTKQTQMATTPYAYAPLDNSTGQLRLPEELGNGEQAKAKGKGTDYGSAVITGGFAVGSAAMDGFTNVNRPRGYYEESGGEMRTQDGMKYGAQGAMLGSKIGSAVGPVGAAIGAVVGGAAGMIGGYSKGKKREKEHNQEVGKRQALYKETEDMNMRYNADPNNGLGNRNTQYYGNGGTLKRDPSMDAISNVITQRNLAKNWVQRGLDPNAPTLPASNGQIMTHRLAYSNDEFGGNYQVYPEIIQLPDGSLKQLSPQQARQYATETNTAIDMPSRSIAEYYSQQGLIKHGNGGPLAPKLTDGFKQMASDSVEVQGPSHAQGGVQVPGTGNEVEGGETIKDDYVYSDRLKPDGKSTFADMHKKLARAKDKIERKPATGERVNAIKRLIEREDKLAMKQEMMKQFLNLQ